MTLIEVVAALAIMGSLMVAMLVTNARHTRQWARANVKIDAVNKLDALMSQWDVDGLPQVSTGNLDDNLMWQIDPVERELPEVLAARVVGVSVYESGSQTSDPLITIEWLVPNDDGDDGDDGDDNERTKVGEPE